MGIAWLKPFFVVKWRPLFIILAVIVLVSLLNPFGLVGTQHIVFGALLFAVGSWATNALDRSLTSILLIVLFLIFGKTPSLSILGYVWSDVILLIATSSLLSVALGKNAWLRIVLHRFVQKTTKRSLVFYMTPYVLGTILIFVIPQAFARVVLLAGLYEALMRKDEELKEQRHAVFFQIYLAVTVTYMLFSNGDVVLNYAALTFAGEDVSAALMGLPWLKMMGVPTVILSAVMLVLTRILFRKSLPKQPAVLFEQHAVAEKPDKTSGRKDAIGLVLMIIVMVFWATEGMHRIPGWIPAVIAVILLFALTRLEKADLLSINPRFLIFLIGVFNIGQVLRNSGVMDAIMRTLERIIPEGGTFIFLPTLILVTMLLHMFLGSAVATLSVVIPIILPLAVVTGVSPVQMTLALYVTANMHFILPFHHSTMMVGVGRGHVKDWHMMRFGLVMSVGIFLVVFGLYFPWWSLVAN